MMTYDEARALLEEAARVGGGEFHEEVWTEERQVAQMTRHGRDPAHPSNRPEPYRRCEIRRRVPANLFPAACAHLAVIALQTTGHLMAHVFDDWCEVVVAVSGPLVRASAELVPS